MESLKKMIDSYERWVASNPGTVNDVETTTKWISYFIAGRISDSNVVSELVYSMSNLMVLYNDRIITRARKYTQANDQALTEPDNAGVCYRLKVMLTSLEYFEVFIEISAKRLFGSRGRWLFISLLQVTKTVMRYFILNHSTAQIITSPALPTINRRALMKKQSCNGVSHRQDLDTKASTSLMEDSFTFELKRSGRIIRKVEGAPPAQYRDFTLRDLRQEQRLTVCKALLYAEYVYIAKPLVHLSAMALFGEKCWKQFITAVAMDLISIRMYHANRRYMNKQQKLEMSRRCINLLFYLMRSPLYEALVQSRLDRVLEFAANNIPLVKLVAGPLREYIPHWQNTYFYMWST